MTFRKRIGKIIIPGGMAQPEPHEFATADVFARAGKDVEFIKPRDVKGSRTPDITLDGQLWEMKSPTGKGKKTVEKQLQRAIKQSRHIIFDSHRTILDDSYIQLQLQKQLALSRSIKRILLVTKKDEIIEIKP